jgi:UDP-2,3-diacylglucosamine pyrophosphatase LpxH
VFFPYLGHNEIYTIVHLGDLVDRRKYINFSTAKRLREDFIQPIRERGMDFHLILGNHDVYYKNTNEVNAIAELYGDLMRYERAEEVVLGGTKFLFIPWITADNREHSIELIRRTDAQVALGHLELQGFEMYRGSISTHGDDARMFDKFDLVCSGHYHHKSTTGNINYLGSHSEFTWSDYNDPRGFHVLDTETRELTFVPNPHTIFAKLWYKDSLLTIDDVANGDYGAYTGKIVKVVVQEKTNPYLFDVFMTNLERANPNQVQVVEDHLNLNIEDDSEIVQEAEDTLTIFRKYIDQINTQSVSKERLNKTISDIYNEALSVE